mgnify:FL=1
MASAKRQQEVAFQRVKDLPASEIKCRFCGESTASSDGWKGFAHKFGPARHRFIAAKPVAPKASEFNARLKSLITFSDKPVSVVDDKNKQLRKRIEELLKKMKSAPNLEN